MKTSLVFFIAVCAALSLRAERQPIDRYQSIIDRQMFGPLPPGFDPTKSPNEVQKTSAMSDKELTKEQEQLRSAVRFSVINVASDGQTQVGFTDSSDPKTPRNYFLKVGESRDGWTVKEADAETAKMTIAKGEIEVTLSLGGNSAQDAKATSRAGMPAGGARTGGLLGGGSLRERRLQRRAEKDAADAAERARQAEEAAAREQQRAADEAAKDAQREQERAEQRQQLLAIQEELKRVREAKQAAEKKDENAQNDAE